MKADMRDEWNLVGCALVPMWARDVSQNLNLAAMLVAELQLRHIGGEGAAEHRRSRRDGVLDPRLIGQSQNLLEIIDALLNVAIVCNLILLHDLFLRLSEISWMALRMKDEQSAHANFSSPRLS